MKSFRPVILLAVILLLGVASCNDDIQKPIYRISSIDEAIIEGESKTIDIQMAEDDWSISGIYALNGMAITDGQNRLQLEGLGSLDAHWFKITRDELSSFKVAIFENYGDAQRAMVIKIKKGDHTEDITIIQKVSDGYEFKEIQYLLENESISYNGNHFSTFIFNNYGTVDNTTVGYPYQNRQEVSYFESDEEGAFSWIGEEGIEVNVPSVVPSRKYFYKKSVTYNPSELKDVAITIDGLAGKQTVATGEFKIKKSVYSYILTLVNKRTQAEKQIKGQWILDKAIDHRLEVKLNELPPLTD